jgi:hypothetical protein
MANRDKIKEPATGPVIGARLPIQCHEGQIFDSSLDGVEFQIAEVSPRQILGDLGDRIAWAGIIPVAPENAEWSSCHFFVSDCREPTQTATVDG